MVVYKERSVEAAKEEVSPRAKSVQDIELRLVLVIAIS